MTTRDDWIDQGMQVLATHGLPGVRIDRMAGLLGVSKGSFHHHFRGVADFRRALLGRYEEQVSRPLTTAGDTTGEQTLRRLAAELPDLYDPRVETALRAWALHDEDAREVVARVDALRLQALTTAWMEILDDPAAARTAALVPHLVAIGGAAAIPALDLQELHQVFRLLTELVPMVPRIRADGPA